MEQAQLIQLDGEIPVGKFLGRHEVEVTPEVVARCCAGCQDSHPWYTSADNPFETAVAPALIGHQEPWRFPGWYSPDVRGTLHAKQEWDLYAPVPVGSVYMATALVADRYLWRADRHVVVNEVSLSDREQRVLARGRTHQSFLRQQPDGYVVDRAREKRSERHFAPGAGEAMERIDGATLLLSPELCLAATDYQDNYHSNPEIAKAMGFPAVVVQGVFNANIVSALMTRRFAEGWWVGGKLRLSFVNVVWGGDSVSAHVAVNELVEETPGARAMCEVWVEKADGTVTAIGTASAVVPRDALRPTAAAPAK
jgi:acyl dehydratase